MDAVRRAVLLAVIAIVVVLYHFDFKHEEPMKVEQVRVSSHGVRMRHIFHHNAGDRYNQHARLDLPSPNQEITALTAEEFALQSKPKVIRRLADRSPDSVESYLAYRRQTKRQVAMELEWSDDVVNVPDLSDRDTMITLARMCQDSYVNEPYQGDWLNVTDPWGLVDSHGWMSDGLRGYVFADEGNNTVVVSIKGTSAAIFDNGGDTATNDKINDNLLFSCCCARVSYLWNTVCDCYTGDSYTCNDECLEDNLYREDRYYRAALDLYRNVTSLYPDANIWVVGHSLGGALSALLGRTYGLPAVGFEAPPELLATKRLHLPMPPGVPLWDDHVWHVGHTADPIYMGVCNGAGSSCWIAGYAMETKCHSGLQCVYDVVHDRGWHVSMVNHRILTVIAEVLETYNSTPECVVPPPCIDCYDWNFVAPTDPVTTSAPIVTSTSTEESSRPTSTSTSASTTTTEPPQTCLKRTWYGWCISYGPADPTSTSDVPTTTPAVTTTPAA